MYKQPIIAALQEFAEYLGVGKQSKIDMNALREQITSDIRERNDFEKATEYVNSEFSDVLSDDIYRNEFIRREQEARNSGDDRSYMDLYKAIATDLRTHKQGQSP